MPTGPFGSSSSPPPVTARSARERTSDASRRCSRLTCGRLWTRLGQRVFAHLAGLRQPTIAAVSGNAYGGGFEMALACDLRILADDATLGLTEVGIGTLPGWGGTGRLRDLVGAGRAKELIFTGEPLTAERALAWGVVTQLAARSRDPERPRPGHQDRQPGPDRGPDGQAGHRRRAGVRRDGADRSAATAYTDDAAEGLASFTEKRDPHYRGT